MKQTEPSIHPDRDLATANRPIWMQVAQDRRRYERLLGLVLWITLFAVLFDFGW